MGRHWSGCSGNCRSRRNLHAGATASSEANECLRQTAYPAERGRRSSPFRLVGFSLTGNCFVTGGPERMFVAAVPIRIAFGGNVLSRGALAFLKWIWIGRHDFGFLDGFDLAFLGAAVFGSDALLRSASFRSTGMPCFLSRSAKASSASSWTVAIRSRESCFSLSKVSSSKSINLRTTGPSPASQRCWFNGERQKSFRRGTSDTCCR